MKLSLFTRIIAGFAVLIVIPFFVLYKIVSLVYKLGSFIFSLRSKDSLILWLDNQNKNKSKGLEESISKLKELIGDE